MSDIKNTIIYTNQHIKIRVPKPTRFIDLFCGIGGFHQALSKLHFQCVYASDKDEECRKIYEKNYGTKPDGDITKVDIAKIPPFDILCAGFPCQPFSKAGQQRGFDDDRGNLFFTICKIAQHHKPKYLILENVRNLSSHDDGNTWKVIKDNIELLGYHTYAEPLILNVLHFNIPQNRERVIIMCKRKDLGPLPALPEIPKDPKLTLTNMISTVVKPSEKEYNEKHAIDGKMKDVEKVWNAFIRICIQHGIAIPKYPIWTDWWDNELTSDPEFYQKYTNWIDKNREFYRTHQTLLEPWLQESRQYANWIGAVRKFEWQAGDALPTDCMQNVLWTPRASGIRVKRLNYIPTLVAMNTTPIYGPESRKLTARELLRLQSFSDGFQFNEKTVFKQIGNAVNVTMIERCARFLILNRPLF